MTKVALAGLAGRKLRAALTAIAIVLGVTMISGTYVLTDTIQSAFSTVFTQANKNSDAVVSGKSAISSNDNGGNDPSTPSLPESLLTQVRSLPQRRPGVRRHLRQRPARRPQRQGDLPGRRSRAGVQLHAPGPAVQSADADGGLLANRAQSGRDRCRHGQQGQLQGRSIRSAWSRAGRFRPFQIAGTAKFAGVSSLGGATMAIFSLPTAQRIFRKVGRVDSISVAAKSGTSPEQLVKEIQPMLPPGSQVKTGQQQAAQQTHDTSSFLNIFRSFLLAFGGIALFVGSFVIANTLSITVAQRTRELATLRTLGATRRQVLTSVLLEAFLIAVFASVIGLFLGLALAKGLNALLVSFGIDLPSAGTVFKTRTIVVSLLVGIVITMLAALRPALRSTRVPPIAAVREGAVLPPSRWARLRGHRPRP